MATLLLAATLPFLAALPNRFVMDDFAEVVENPIVAGEWNWQKGLLADFHAGRGDAASGLYRPATIVAYRLIALAARDPAGHLIPLPFHLVNLLLHAAGVLAGYAALRAAGAGRGASAAASLLFAVHPVQADVVAPASGLKDLLATAAGLGSLAAWLRHRSGGAGSDRLPGDDRRRQVSEMGRRAGFIPWLAACCGLLLIALLAKESAAALPALFLAADGLGLPQRRGGEGATGPVRRRGFAALAPSWLAVAAVLVVAFGLRVAATGGLYRTYPIQPVDNPLVELPLLQARWSALNVASRAAAILAMPYGFSHDYSADSIPLSSSPFDPPALAGAALLIAAVVAVGWLAGQGWFRARSAPAGSRQRETLLDCSLIGFGLVSFLALWLVVSNLLVRIGSIFAPRMLTLPMWGLCAAAGVVGWGILSRFGTMGRRVMATAAAVCLVLLAAGSWVRCGDWKDDDALNSSALRVVPRNAKALSNLAAIRMGQGRFPEAAELARRSIEIRPERIRPQLVLASLLDRQGHPDQALRLLEDVVARSPRPSPAVRVELARLLLGAGRAEEASGQIERSLADPDRQLVDEGAALWLRGRMLRLEGSDRDAAAVLDRADAALPRDARVLHERGLARFSIDRERALADLREAVAIDPREPVFLYDAGVGHLEAGRPAEAAGYLVRYLEIDPEHREAWLSLARALDQTGRKDQARAALRDWLARAPGDGEAREALDHLGR
jgi:tetratricopeptide (TPR) repeat protein